MRYLNYSLLFLLPLLLFSWQTPANQQWQRKVDPRLLEESRSQKGLDMLVLLNEQLQPQTSNQLSKEEKAWEVFEQLREAAETSQRGLMQWLEREEIAFRRLYIVNALQLRGDLSLLEQLAKREDVARIVDNGAIRVSRLEASQPVGQRGPRNLEWGVERVRAHEVWALGYRGAGVVVGGEDTGYDWMHPALQSRYRGWNGTSADHNYNWHDAIRELNPLNEYPNDDPSNNSCGLDVDVPCDDQGHGTWTMGIMVGSDGDNQVGVAPDAQWIGCRNMENGWGSPFSYLECLEWFLAPTDLNGENPDPTKAPHVINNSWVCPEVEGCNPSNWGMIEQAINNLRSAGVFVVVAAGNDGREGCSSINKPPSIFENSFAVGSIEPNDSVSNFSSRGPVTVDGSGRIKPNVMAPGRNIRSSQNGGGYMEGTGTSGSAPFVAGTVALMISANPDLAGQVELLEDILEQTVSIQHQPEDCGDLTAIPNNTYGFGSLDALAAVEEALNLITSTTEVPSANPWPIYPNPTRDQVYFDLPSTTSSAWLELFDATGKRLQVLQQPFNGQAPLSLSLKAYPAGLYFYRLQIGAQQWSGRLLRQ
ncbi:MAG: S8 family peptidase [Bacteroidota bacterium]